jgi:uncharacterized NAD(P)/FAD-binding protein YdhS
MTASRIWDLAVIGGGYGGAVTALETVRLARRPLHVAVIEPRAEIGRGIAYSTPDDAHRLNTRAKRMSLVPGDDSHFTTWAQAFAHTLAWSEAVDDDSFAPRHWFGRYVAEQLKVEVDAIGATLAHVRDEALDLSTDMEGWLIHLRGSPPVTARQAVLAVGNLPRRGAALPGLASSDTRVLHAWEVSRATADPGAEVLIIGTGLTMVDAVLSLRARGHRGVVHAVSRHALLPLAHSEAHGRAQPLLSKSLRVALRELRLGAELDKRSGRPWQWRIDANRHHAQALWSGLSIAEKRRFLRHVRTYWDVHRHRIADFVRTQLDAEIAAGGLVLHAGRVGAIEPSTTALRVHVHTRDGQLRQLEVGLLLNSLGFELDYRRADAPLVQGLFRSGLARPGELGLGFDTDVAGRIRAADGRPWPALYTLGTARIGQLWETTAAHEIRLQAAELAGAIVRGLPTSASRSSFKPASATP